MFLSQIDLLLEHAILILLLVTDDNLHPAHGEFFVKYILLKYYK